ncbi:hypothetical protein [Microbacterium sp. zg-YB36]|uniref:hypothetical protein n=1 Tax=Microbacterium sp. zg-YB36 TaxID=2969407 RepID=UPI00214B579F|nr:hypothetical protein [Microbacterium sp. zg-YB36]MDL5351169.1 hypothetical protein [Microbacterium sp. zg-YB36]
MSTITKTITAYTEEGYLTLGDLRRLLEQSSNFENSARVTAGVEGAHVERIDTLNLEDAAPAEEAA